ncbi:hypothetical protein Tco_1186906 [Tanacetum coccineum]
MNSLTDTHVKLLAFDLLSLKPSPSHPTTNLKPTTKTPITRIETLSIVTLRDLKPDRFLKFYIDDGTGCIPCVLWLNHLTSLYFQDFAHQVFDYLLKTRVNVGDVFVERDANAEILHWLQCVRLGRVCYDVGRVDDDKMIID